MLSWLVLAAMMLLYAILFSWLAVARHEAFQSHAFDLGNMDQAVWNTLHGRFLRFTDMEVAGRVLTSRLAIHVEPLLAAFAPLYLFHSGPETLLVLQAVVVGLGAWPAYLLGRLLTGRSGWSLVFPAAYLLHPSLQNAVLDDFHAVTLTACFLLWALYFAARRMPLAFAIAAILAAACKEEIGLMVAVLGIVWFLRGDRRTGVVALAGGIIWFVLCIRFIIPGHNPAGASPYLSRYAYLGHGLGGMLSGAARHPGLVLRTLLSTPRLAYLTDLLHPLGYTPLVALPVLVLAAPDFLINMLSADPRMFSGFYQYSAEIIPYLIAAGGAGVAVLDRASRQTRVAAPAALVPSLCLLILISAGYDSWRYGFSPASYGYIIPSAGPHQTAERRILALIPPNAVVAAADEIEPHLSDRRWIYLLPTIHPENGPAARFIVLDASIPADPVEPHTLHTVAVRALAAGYGIRAADDGVLLLERGVRARALPAAFYRFIFASSTHVTSLDARWGGLHLAGVIAHPRNGLINRSRPAVGVDTYWRVTRPLPAGIRITFYLSPPYHGAHPDFSPAWKADRDSPSWDWLAPARWPSGRMVRASSLGLTPTAGAAGLVDVAVGVAGLGPTRGLLRPMAGSGGAVVRVATFTVEP